jgi:ribosomal protein L24E
MIVQCHWCGKDVEKHTGHVNRAKKEGCFLFCNKVCFGLNRRKPKTEDEKREIKRLYDIEYRKKNNNRIKSRMQKYNASPAGRAMQKRNREKFKESHKEYIKQPKYRVYKKDYDQKYCAKKNYGEFWESSLVLKEIEQVIEPEKAELKIQKGTYNKSQKRKRLWNSMQKTLNKHYGIPSMG